MVKILLGMGSFFLGLPNMGSSGGFSKPMVEIGGFLKKIHIQFQIQMVDFKWDSALDIRDDSIST